MQVRILKGTEQIGGCITEITSNKGTKIIIDFGEDLPSENEIISNDKPMIDGLTTGEKKYDGVFITHSHGDHIGLINYILEDIDVYVEEYSKVIYNLTCDFTAKEVIKKDTKVFEFDKAIMIKDIKITPYLVDHSSFNSCMFLIEADGQRILHTGDYRSHGRKGKIFASTLKKIGKIDCLITEGTTLGRGKTKYETEDELYEKALDIFSKYDNIFVLQSSTNIDRIVSFYKAAIKTKKYFVEDLFTATIASSLPKSIPGPDTHRNVSVWISDFYKSKKEPTYFVPKYVVPMEKYKNNQAFHHKICMLVKTSMLDDIKWLKKEKHIFNNTCFIYSMWDGYLKNEKMKKFKDELEELGFHYEYLHTSGHADMETMKLLKELLKPDKIITIHTDNKEKAKEVFGAQVLDIEDDELIDV